MSELRETLINITEEKNAKIIPSNIKEGVQIFDVVGEYKGRDMSDANITAEDVAIGKIGYNQDGQVIGTVETIIGTSGGQVDTVIYADDGITSKHTFTAPVLFRGNSSYTLTAPQSAVAEAIDLTADKLVKGNIVLGVEGTTEVMNTSDATAYSSDIAKGKTAYIKTGITTGTLEEITDVYDAGNSTEYSLNDNYKWFAIYGEQIKDYIFRKGSKILLKADYTALANLIGIKPEEVKAGITYLGIEGTLENLDTSDGTAVPGDILKDKVAYVNGERVVGELETLEDNITLNTNSLSVDAINNQLTMEGSIPNTGIVNNSAVLQMSATGEQVVDAIGLAPDMLKSGTNILGVEGTYSGDSGEYNAKLEIPEGAKSAPSPLAMLTSIASINTTNLSAITGIFNGCVSLKSVPEMNVRNVHHAGSAFKNCHNLVYTPNLYTPRLVTITSMFENCYNISYINLTALNNGMSNAHFYYSSAFANCYSLKEIPNLFYNNGDTYANMCLNCLNLVDVDFKGSYTNASTSIQLDNMFKGCINLNSFNGFKVDCFHPYGTIYLKSMFENCNNLTEIRNVNIKNGNIFSDNMFRNCVNLYTLDNYSMPFSGSANYTFANCYNLVNAYTSGYVHIYPYQGAYNTFENCYNLKFNNGWVNATLIGGNRGAVSYTFVNCHSITSANLLTSATNYGVYYTFYNCSNLKQANITINGAASGLFINCSNLQNVYINHSVITSYVNFFTNCTSLDNISTSITNLNWEGLTSGYGMFTGCTGLINFGVSRILGYNTDNMFNGCTNLVDMSNTTITSARITSNMFRNCTNLQKAGELQLEYNASSRPVFSNMYVNCVNLTDVPGIYFSTGINMSNANAFIAPFGVYNAVINGSILPLHKLVNFGGFINYGINMRYHTSGANNSMKAVDIVAAPNLSYQSLQNVINGVYNLYTAYGIAEGGTLTYPQLIRMANTQYEKLTEDDIGILTSKGWNITVHNIGG